MLKYTKPWCVKLLSKHSCQFIAQYKIHCLQTNHATKTLLTAIKQSRMKAVHLMHDVDLFMWTILLSENYRNSERATGVLHVCQCIARLLFLRSIVHMTTGQAASGGSRRGVCKQYFKNVKIVDSLVSWCKYTTRRFNGSKTKDYDRIIIMISN